MGPGKDNQGCFGPLSYRCKEIGLGLVTKGRMMVTCLGLIRSAKRLVHMAMKRNETSGTYRFQKYSSLGVLYPEAVASSGAVDRPAIIINLPRMMIHAVEDMISKVMFQKLDHALRIFS